MDLLVLSDLHLEMHDYEPATSGFDVVVLAGDIHTKARGVRWAQERFTVPVIYVPGNHEGYGSHWQNVIEKMRQMARGSHVHVLNNQSLVLDGVRFVGSTAWTDFSIWPNRPEAMMAAGAGRDPYSPGARDYRHIRTSGYRRILPADTATWASQSKAFLRQEFEKAFDGPTVVATHHPPSEKSLPHGRALEPLDATDANRWDDLVEASGAALWCHGHTHHPVDYRLGKTQVVSNPVGYPGQGLEHNPNGVWSV